MIIKKKEILRLTENLVFERVKVEIILSLYTNL